MHAHKHFTINTSMVHCIPQVDNRLSRQDRTRWNTHNQSLLHIKKSINQFSSLKWLKKGEKKTVRTINNAEIHDKTTPTKHGGTNSDVQKTQMKNMETWATTNIEAQ